MMLDFVAEKPTWVVLTELKQLLTVDTGQQFTSNQVCEQFTNEADAIARAVEIGWVEEVPDEELLLDEPPEWQ